MEYLNRHTTEPDYFLKKQSVSQSNFAKFQKQQAMVYEYTQQNLHILAIIANLLI